MPGKSWSAPYLAPAGDLQRAIQPAGHARLPSVSSSSARTTVRFTKDTLKPFADSGLAPSAATDAASSKDACVAGAPRKAASTAEQPPRHGRHATDRHPGVDDARVPDVQRDRGGAQRELVGLPVPHLDVGGARRPVQPRDKDLADQLTRAQVVLHVGRVTGQAVEVGQRDGAASVGADQPDLRVERDQRDGHVAGVGGHARRRSCPARRASGWRPEIAGQPLPGCRLLHGVATSRKYVQRVRCNRLPPMLAMFRSCWEALSSKAREIIGYTPGCVATSLIRSSAPIRSPSLVIDPAQRQSVDVQDVLRRQDVELHQVDEGGSAGQERTGPR